MTLRFVFSVILLICLPLLPVQAEPTWKACNDSISELCGDPGTKGRMKCAKEKSAELPGGCSDLLAKRIEANKEKKKIAKKGDNEEKPARKKGKKKKDA